MNALDYIAGRIEAWAGGLLAPAPERPPLFIVGPPRCGTTLVYQHLTNRFRFGYIPNIAEAHPQTPLTYVLLGKLTGRHRPSYANEHGEIAGLMAPSDGWRIFHRWFPRYDLSEPVDSNVFGELPRIVGALESFFDAPFINKNNHNSVRLDTLLGAFPDARILHVTRDHRDATVSLLKARRTHDVAPGEWWSCPPPQYFDRHFDDPIQQSAYTIVGIDQYLEDRLSRLPSAHSYRISYEAFCDDPLPLEEWVERTYRKADVDLDAGPLDEQPQFQSRSKPSEHDDAVRRALEQARATLESA